MSEMNDDKKTILSNLHQTVGAKMVSFAGYWMPLEYVGISEEHEAVRKNCGLFDVSHMGEIEVTGKDTLNFLNYLLTSNIKNAPTMKMTYGLLLYHDGGVVDDLMVYKYSDTKCLLVVNASNKDKDYQWLVANIASFAVDITDLSDHYSQLALQGPKAVEVLKSLTSDDIDQLKLFMFKELKIDKAVYLVSRSGYTGEDGFEIYGANQDILMLAQKLTKMNVQWCGLGCRDTLRFEAAMPLYGHEINADITPLEAGLNYALDFDKEFIGRSSLLKQKAEGLKRKLVGLELKERGIARQGYNVLNENDEIIGTITTGYMIPNTSNCYAMAYIDLPYCRLGTSVYVQIRKNKVHSVIRNKKFLEKKYVR